MTIRAGDGRVDARKLMEAERYAGEYRLGGIVVRYPEGCEATAREVGRALADTANLAAIHLGIEWSFRLEARLVRVPRSVTGLRYSVNLNRDRNLVFPVFLNEDGRVRAEWAPTVAHEMTEASLLAPRQRRSLVLGDIYWGSFCLPLGTRWFRDGVADRAGEMLGSRLFGDRYRAGGSGYAELAAVGPALLDWANCKDAPDWYDAASALIREAESRAGPDAVGKVMIQLAREEAPGGREVARAFERATGLALRDWLARPDIGRLGAEFADTDPDVRNPPLVLPGNRVVVTRVHEGSAASRWELAKGDEIASVDGAAVGSSWELANLIAEHRPGDFVCIAVRRGGEAREMRIKLGR